MRSKVLSILNLTVAPILCIIIYIVEKDSGFFVMGLIFIVIGLLINIMDSLNHIINELKSYLKTIERKIEYLDKDKYKI